ncbi:MAG: hypothetical protein AAF618_06710 [Pseudomonadota bacterium]
MLEEKRKDLASERKRALLRRLVSELSAADPDLYYRPTSQIALSVIGYARDGAGLNADEKALLTELTPRDVEVLLSLH